MPLSEDEFVEVKAIQDHQVTMSKADLRKTHKPIMEKKRRARINHCLNEIKMLILEAMNKDPARHSKLEKADILEMAVKHLQNVQRQQLAVAVATDPSVLRKFRTGFNECASEIDRYVERIDPAESGLRERVSEHLQRCIGGIEQIGRLAQVASNAVATNISQQHSHPHHNITDDPNNNGNAVSIRLIPSRLPNGELALLVPNDIFPPSAQQSTIQSTQPPALHNNTPASTTRSSAFAPLNRVFRPVPRDGQVQQVSSTQEPSSVRIGGGEPLSVITNQGERYRQAAGREDTSGVENILWNSGATGNKRKHDGLLTTIEMNRPAKNVKIERINDVTVQQEVVVIDDDNDNNTNDNNNDIVNNNSNNNIDNINNNNRGDADRGEPSNDNMWRPW